MSSLPNKKKKSLRAISLIKEKRDGSLKGRTCADGRKQRKLYEKADTTSPTISNDALMLSILVDAHEGRDVATADVAGAFLKADMDDFVLLRFEGQEVDILCELNPSHKDHVIIENGKKALYVQLLKALYGCVRSSLLWYILFSGTLKEHGFDLNPYDPCIANKMIKGKQCTIAWYVDDTKISHIDPAVVTSIIKLLENSFDKMTITRGRNHTFLGLDITFTDQGTAEINMRKYLQDAIVNSEFGIMKTVTTPAKPNLFVANESSPKLSPRNADRFHSTVATLLYASMRARMDILLPVIYLCTRVSKCTVEDQDKLRRVLEYLNGTLDLVYTLGTDSLNNIVLRTWVDASFAVHPDMRSHTGAVSSLGTGGIMCRSSKQKLNSKSSTESEIIGASDYLPNAVWIKNFLEAQGYVVSTNILEQEKESAIKIEKNGRASASNRSRHIDIRYFFTKDQLRRENIKVRHCPTTVMLADFFTKPLQGNLFRKFRDVILGYKHVDSLSATKPSGPEERVGKDRSVERPSAVGKSTSMKESWASVVAHGHLEQ